MPAVAEEFHRIGERGGKVEEEDDEDDAAAAFPHGKLEAFPRLCLFMVYSCTYFPLLRRENKSHRAF